MSTATEPTGVAQVVTPSGLEIYYQAGPKRLYRVNGEEVPSVSTVLNVLEKGGLSWWGMKVGIQGVGTLLQKCNSQEATDRLLSLLHTDEVDEVLEDLKGQKLTVNHVKDKAAGRGTNVHAAIEAWAESGVTPEPKFFPENERGYVEAFVSFLNDAHPYPLASEVMVGSAKYGFAGRFDLLANLDFAGQVVVKSYPKRDPVREQLAGVWLIDAKSKSPTASKTYTQHKIQLGGYELGMQECGHAPPDHKGVLNLWPDGRYELDESLATGEDFLSVLETYKTIERLG